MSIHLHHTIFNNAMHNSVKFILCLFTPLLVGGVSGFFTSTNITTWYAFLNKPSFNPPNYLFGPVWTVLYLLMGVSFYMVLKQPKVPKPAIAIFIIQLTLNFFWSIIFFRFHALGLAFIEILMLLISICIMIVLFYKVNKWAAILNIPYLMWVGFASVLNFSIYYLN